MRSLTTESASQLVACELFCLKQNYFSNLHRCIKSAACFWLNRIVPLVKQNGTSVAAMFATGSRGLWPFWPIVNFSFDRLCTCQLPACTGVFLPSSLPVCGDALPSTRPSGQAREQDPSVHAGNAHRRNCGRRWPAIRRRRGQRHGEVQQLVHDSTFYFNKRGSKESKRKKSIKQSMICNDNFFSVIYYPLSRWAIWLSSAGYSVRSCSKWSCLKLRTMTSYQQSSLKATMPGSPSRGDPESLRYEYCIVFSWAAMRPN